jgi:hypothetical protein
VNHEVQQMWIQPPLIGKLICRCDISVLCFTECGFCDETNMIAPKSEPWKPSSSFRSSHVRLIILFLDHVGCKPLQLGSAVTTGNQAGQVVHPGNRLGLRAHSADDYGGGGSVGDGNGRWRKWPHQCVFPTLAISMHAK